MPSVKEAAEKIKRALSAAQLERDVLRGEVPDAVAGCNTQQWVLFERWTVLAAVNRIRHECGLSPVAERTLAEQAEWPATGHCDYTKQYAWYAAELAVGVREHKPVTA